MLAEAILALSLCHVHAGLPDQRCTPGSFNPAVTQATIYRTICVPGWTSTVRPSSYRTRPLKLQSMAEYGLRGDPSEYEYDHLVPLELGGALIDTRNLWPEPYLSRWGARVKDTVENRLHRLVCDGVLSLRIARRLILRDWRRA